MTYWPRQQGSTSYPIEFLLVLSIDHTTGATGKAPTVTISKNGGAFGPASGAVTEMASGWYSLAGNASDRDTLGGCAFHVTATGCDARDFLVPIITADMFAANLGITNVSVGDIAAAALAKFFTLNTTKTYADAVAGSVVKEIVTNVAVSTSAIADAVWNRLTTAITTAGSIGKLIIDKLNGLGAAVTLVAPVLSSGALALVQADDYDAADGASRAVQFLLTGTDLNLAGASVKLEMNDFESVGTISGAAPDYTFAFTLTSAETALFVPGRAAFQVRIILANGHRVTFTQDLVNVTRRIGT